MALTRRSEVVPEVNLAWLREVARNERNLELLRGLGIGSLMSVPLVARGDVLGAMTFVAPEYAHHYTADDLSLGEDLAARAAIAIDNGAAVPAGGADAGGGGAGEPREEPFSWA